MIKTTIESLETLLSEARKKGCKQVKLQLYDNWEDAAKEQQNPTHPPEDYQVDVRFYNTVEFETEIKEQTATDKLLTKTQDDTLILRVALSDRETLFRNLGIEED